jgi:hypothetical protein
MSTETHLDERRRRLSGRGRRVARRRERDGRLAGTVVAVYVVALLCEDPAQAVTAWAAWLPGVRGWCRPGVARCPRSSVGRPGAPGLRVGLTPVARRPSRRAEIAPGGTGSERGHTASGWCQAATRAPGPPVSGSRRNRPSCWTPPPRKPSPHGSPVAARHASSGRAGRSQSPRPRAQPLVAVFEPAVEHAMSASNSAASCRRCARRRLAAGSRPATLRPESRNWPSRSPPTPPQLTQQFGDPISWACYLGSADFRNRTFQNWQSEFLAVYSAALFAIYLRQPGSPEPKPVGSTHAPQSRRELTCGGDEPFEWAPSRPPLGPCMSLPRRAEEPAIPRHARLRGGSATVSPASGTRAAGHVSGSTPAHAGRRCADL